MNPTYSSSYLYDKNRPIYNSPTPLNYRPTTSTYSQPVQYTSHYTSNINPNPHPSDNHSLSQSPPTNYAQQYYPNSSMMSPKTKTTTEYPSYKPTIHSYTPNVTNSRMSPPRNIAHSAKLPKGNHLSSIEVDEFSERNSVQSQFMSPTGQKYTYSAPKETHMAAQQPLHSISGVHHVPNVRVSPFNRSGKDKISFFEPQQYLEKRDELSSHRTTTALQFQHENHSKGPQASALHSLLSQPKSPKKGRIKIPDVIFKRHLSDKIREVFTSPKTFECLAQFFDFDDLARFRNVYPEHRSEKGLKKIAKKRLDKLILHIKTKEDQYKFWNSMVDFRKRRNDNPLAFSQHFVRKCEYIRDITKDLDRTFPEYDKFQTERGRDGLLKVLVAISNTIKEVGYIQGLNSVAAVFLYYLKEEESFWILLYLMERVKAKEIFKTDFTKVSILNYQLETFVHYYLPTVAQYFEEQPMSLTTLTTQWFITLYSYCLSIPNIARVWNYFFVRGYPFFIQFGLAIFSRYKRTIMTMNVDEIGPFFKEELRQLDENDESIFRSALEFKVTTRLLNDLEGYYKKGKPKLLLIFDTQNKGQWTEIPSSPSERPADISISSQTNLPSEPQSKVKSESATIKNPATPTTTTEQSKSATLQNKPKIKSPISLQNIVNTIKIDLSDTIKNIFNRTKDPNKEANTEPNSAVAITKSSFIDDEKTIDKSLTIRLNPSQPSKPEPIEKERDNSSRHNSILVADMQGSRPGSIYLPDQIGSRDRIDQTPSGQDTFKSSYSDVRSVYSPIKPTYSPRFKAGQFDMFSKESSPVISVGDGRTPLYGRSKIRPTNNSIDASDFTTWSAEKDFIRNLQINLSNQKYQDTNTRSTNNSMNNFNGVAEDLKRSPTTGTTALGNRNRLAGDGYKAPTTLTLFPIESASEDLYNYGAGYKKSYEGDIYHQKSATSSPIKQIDLKNKVMMRNDVGGDLPSSSRKTGYYSVIGDFKKYP